MTSTEVTRRTFGEVVHPTAGTVLDLGSAATDEIARERKAVIDEKRSLDQYAAALDEALTDRLDRMGRRSAEVGGWTIETRAPTTTDYPLDAVRAALEDLVDADLLDDEIVDEVLVPQPVTYKLNRVRLNTLLKHADERVRKALEACAVEEPVARRSVTVKEPSAR